MKIRLRASGATASMVADYLILSMNKKLSGGSIRSASGEVMNAKRKGTSDLQLSRVTGPVKLDQFLPISKISYNQVSVSALCDNNHTFQVTKNSCVIKMKRNVVGVSRCTNGMYAVDFNKVKEQQALAAQETDVSVIVD